MAELEGVFEACVAQLKSGTPLDACLAMHPAQSAELSPLLRIVANLYGLAAAAPAMEQNTAQAARARFLARASAMSRPTQISAEEAFEQSIALIAAGASLEDCLDRFPHHAASLRPMLQTVVDLRQVNQPARAPDFGAQAARREMFLARAAALNQPPSVPVEEALNTSLDMVAAGATVQECLQAFPHYARELRSALAITGALQVEIASPAPARPAQSSAARREAFMGSANAARRAARQTGVGWRESLAGLFRQPAWVRAAALMLVVLLTLGFGRVAVSMAAVALPGDTLYPVKLAAEQARLWVTSDEGQRATLREQFEQTRRKEAAVVAEQRRQVQVQFPGAIESMVDGVWRIAGLEMPVLVAGNAVVRGQPAVGANVIILAYSDGSGSLEARQVLVLAPVDVLPPIATATRTPTRTPRSEPPMMAPPLPATATWTPGARPTFTRTPTASPTLTPTGMTTPSGTATTTTTPSVTATATATPLPRPVTFYGAIQMQSATWWMVGGRGVVITSNTVIDESQGPAVIGANVQVDGFEQEDGSVVALSIRVQSSSVDTETFTGIIRQMGGSQWLIGNRWVIVDGSTQIIGVPEIGKAATVEARRVAGGPWSATRIEVAQPEEPVYIEGVISQYGTGIWVVADRTIVVTGDTVITGAPPQIGLTAEVEAILRDGVLLARWINVIAPTPAPTWTPTAQLPTPTPTDPLEPTPTPTDLPPPSATPTSEPPLATPTPTTGLPVPTSIGTATPAPPTATPVATPTPAPTFPFPSPAPPTATPFATATTAPTFPFPSPAPPTATPFATATTAPPFPFPSPPP